MVLKAPFTHEFGLRLMENPLPRYATVGMGQPPQDVEMDLNMLASDFYVVKTSSQHGHGYEDFFSTSISRDANSIHAQILTALATAKSSERPYPACTLPNDEFHFPTINQSVSLSFAYCRPQKFTRKTLGPSGSILGLAASKHLAQTKSGSLIAQLVQNKVIERPIFSLMLINGREGVLSLGGTSAAAVDMVVKQTKAELDRTYLPSHNFPFHNVSRDKRHVLGDFYFRDISYSSTPTRERKC